MDLKEIRGGVNTGDEFAQGFVCACAAAYAMHGHDVVVRETLDAGGYTSALKMRKLGCEENDIKVLMPILKEIGARRRKMAT